MEDIIYYKSKEALNHKYYQVPQELFVNPLYSESLSLESKMLYSLLLDRLSLSIKNDWCDDKENIYLIFTRDEASDILNLSYKTITKAFKELQNLKLIYEKKQGFGKPNIIYVGKLKQEDKKPKSPMRKNYGYRYVNFTDNDTQNLPTINTNNNYTLQEENISSDDIKSKCNLDDFKDSKEILEDVIDNLFNASSLNIGSTTITKNKILNKLNLITKNNLNDLIHIIKNSPNVKNLTNYLMVCLYNNLGSNNLIKARKTNKAYVGRTYDEGSLDLYYDN